MAFSSTTADRPEAVPFNGVVDVSELAVGDCIGADPATSSTRDIPLVSCGLTHDAEVFAVLELPPGDFPGEQRIGTVSNGACSSRFVDVNVRPPNKPDDFAIGSYLPDEGDWAVGNRTVRCVLTPAGGGRLVTQVLAGAGGGQPA